MRAASPSARTLAMIARTTSSTSTETSRFDARKAANRASKPGSDWCEPDRHRSLYARCDGRDEAAQAPPVSVSRASMHSTVEPQRGAAGKDQLDDAAGRVGRQEADRQQRQHVGLSARIDALRLDRFDAGEVEHAEPPLVAGLAPPAPASQAKRFIVRMNWLDALA